STFFKPSSHSLCDDEGISPKLISVTPMPRCDKPVTNSRVYVQTPPTVSAVTKTCIPTPQCRTVSVPGCRCNLCPRKFACNNDGRAPTPDRPAARKAARTAEFQGTGTSALVRSPTRHA